MSCWMWALVIFLAAVLLYCVIGAVVERRFSRLEDRLDDLDRNTPPFTDWRRTLERNKPRTH